jgi:hypothetical protein
MASKEKARRPKHWNLQSESDYENLRTYRAFGLLRFLEPKLCDLENRVRKMVKEAEGKHSFCAIEAFIGSGKIKAELMALVGYGRGYPEDKRDTTEGKPKTGNALIDGAMTNKELMAYGESEGGSFDFVSLGTAKMRPRLPADSKGEDLLRTSNAYDIVYDFLYHLLPDCRNCNCCE